MAPLHDTLRAFWSHKQGLDGGLAKKTPAGLLEHAGWARSIGSAGPYLGMFARAGLSREAVDAAVAALEIHELPTARGCTYVVPAREFAFGLRSGASFIEAPLKVAYKLGVTEKEVDRLCDAVLKALAKGPLDPDGIRAATGSASRSLGDEGKKKGVSTTMPLALGKLQALGEIRRVPVNGRLDQQRYKYALWRPNPMRGFTLSDEDVVVELARRLFTWIGPATLSELQAFTALGVKAGKSAAAALKLEPVAPGSDLLMLPEDRERFASFSPPKDPQYSLVSSVDAAVLRGLELIVDASDRTARVFVEKDYKAFGELSFLPSHAILDRGRVVGLWEYDVESSEVAWMTFVKPNKAIESAVERTETFVRDQLGDARQISLDSPKSRAPRIEALRKASGRTGGRRPAAARQR